MMTLPAETTIYQDLDALLSALECCPDAAPDFDDDEETLTDLTRPIPLDHPSIPGDVVRLATGREYIVLDRHIGRRLTIASLDDRHEKLLPMLIFVIPESVCTPAGYSIPNFML